MRFKYVLFAGILVVCVVGIWAVILIVPPWNPRAVIYVIAVVIIAFGYGILQEIRWHRDHPEESRRITEVEVESREQEARTRAEDEAETKRRNP